MGKEAAGHDNDQHVIRSATSDEIVDKSHIPVHELFTTHDISIKKTCQKHLQNTDEQELLSLIDRMHFFDFVHRGFCDENIVRVLSNNIEVYRNVVSTAVKKMTVDNDQSITSHLRVHIMQQAFEEQSIGEESSNFNRVFTAEEVLHFCESSSSGCASVSVLLALQEESYNNPEAVYEITCLCLRVIRFLLQQICRIMRKRANGHASNMHELMSLLYSIKVGLMFCMEVHECERLAWETMKHRFFQYDREDYTMFEGDFSATFETHANYFEPNTLLFSRHSPSEPRCFLDVVSHFFQHFGSESELKSLPYNTIKIIENLKQLTQEMSKMFTLSHTKIQDMMHRVPSQKNPMCIPKYAPRFTRQIEEDPDETDLFTMGVRANSRDNQRRLQKRKRSRAQQRHAKEGHRDMLDEQAERKSAASAIAYKKLLMELEQQEHAMKTVDHHKALAMQGKKKKK